MTVRIVLLFLLLSTFAMAVHASRPYSAGPPDKGSNRTGQQSVGIGIGTLPHLPNYSWGGGWCLLGGGCYDYDYYYRDWDLFEYYYGPKTFHGKRTGTATLFVDYGYRVKSWLDVGGYLAYYGTYCKVYDRFTRRKTANSNTYYVFVMPTLKFLWHRGRAVEMYSGFGLGINLTLDNSPDEYDGLSLSFSPIFLGMTVGRGKVFGFGEFGYGSRGLLNIGIGYRF